MALFRCRSWPYDGMQNPHQCFSEEQEIPLKVIEFDENQKKIVLSARDYFRDKDQSDA